MKVWMYNGSVEVVFCDHGRDAPSSFVPQVVRGKRMLPFVRASVMKPQAAGNDYRVWNFSTRKEFSTVSLAQAWLLTLHETIPVQGDVFVELDDRLTIYKLADCLVEFSPAALTGVLARVGWALTFGELVVDQIRVVADGSPFLQSGGPLFHDGVGYVNATGAPVDGHTKPELNTEWAWPTSPATGDYVYSDLLGLPTWYDGAGWINFSGAPADGHTRPAANGSYTRPADPDAGDMEFDEALLIPIWWLSDQWINATGAPV